MPLRRAGEYADKETGSFYNYFRTLDPAIDRYQQSDLVGLAAGVNTYTRVLSDPLNRIDPLGLATTIPGPNGIPVPVPVPPPGGPGSSPGSGGKGGLIPPELDPNRPQPKTFPEIRVPPFPPSSPPPQGKSICEHLFNQCIKGAEVCPPPITQVGRAFCLAAYILCITISGSGGSGGDPSAAP
jgi:RHS repeat-associated protein